MNKLTPAVKNSITDDWKMLLPQFAVHQPMYFARRIGPLVQGICLDRDSSNVRYFPTLFVHCLCRPFPVLTLSLAQPLLSIRSGMKESISIRSHSERYRDACTQLTASSLLPVAGDWCLSAVLTAYEKYRHLDRNIPYPIMLMEDAVSVCAWLGKPDDASALALHYVEVASSWPDNVLARRGGLPEWSIHLNHLAKSVDKLRQNVVEQAAELKLSGLPASHLLP